MKKLSAALFVGLVVLILACNGDTPSGKVTDYGTQTDCNDNGCRTNYCLIIDNKLSNRVCSRDKHIQTQYPIGSTYP